MRSSRVFDLETVAMHSDRLARKHIVLIGVGHTNAHIVRMWRMNAFPDTDLTCVSDHPVATYSGMLPAVLAGQVPEQAMQIDLLRLCGYSGARLVIDSVVGLDHDSRLVQFQDRPPIPYDVLSVGVGSVPTTEGVAIESDMVLKIKPMQTFLQRLEAALCNARVARSGRKVRVAVVGGGVAGVEMLLCLPARIAAVLGQDYELVFVSRSQHVPNGVTSAVQKRIRREIGKRDVAAHFGESVARITPGEIYFEDGDSVEADIVIWAAGAAPPPLLSSLSLPTDPRGFLLTDKTLQSVSGHPVFAVGDTGSVQSLSYAKSGVYAVRQGPVLWENLRRSLEGTACAEFQPQRSFLKLINLGDTRAVGQWHGLTLHGKWVLRWKHSIDQGFMEKFSVPAASSDDSMQCQGCGCKFGADPLSAAIEDSLLEQSEPEDAARIGESDSGWLAATDFFAAPFDDAYLVGRITALHSASDLVASGASVRQAIANVVLPEGDRQSQQRLLSDFLKGAQLEFDAMGARIVGGHTIVGPRFECGFTVTGPLIKNRICKGGLKAGDQLFLTRPLGVGVLLAAKMRNQCPATAYYKMLEAILQRQHPYAEIAAESEILAGTDVTGFGLAGHLSELLAASRVSATIRLDRLPCLFGALSLVREGVESSLAPENRRVEKRMEFPDSMKGDARFKLLFDPQTCGGLLLGVPHHQVKQFTATVERYGLDLPSQIGEVTGDHPTGMLHVVSSSSV